MIYFMVIICYKINLQIKCKRPKSNKIEDFFGLINEYEKFLPNHTTRLNSNILIHKRIWKDFIYTEKSDGKYASINFSKSKTRWYWLSMHLPSGIGTVITYKL